MVIEQKMDEKLLGMPFLIRIGLDLDQHLARVREQINGYHLGDISNGKIAWKNFSGIGYEHNDYRVEPPEHTKDGFRKEDPGEIQQALQTMIGDSKNSDMRTDGAKQLSDILEEFK